MINKSLLNVFLLGLAFMLIFTAFQTMGNIEKTILTSIQNEDHTFNGEAYYSLAIIYVFFSVFNWIAPSVISVIGSKFSMLIGGVTYMLFILSFLIPRGWLLYTTSAILGVGAALIWTGQGNYLTLNSTKKDISRNSGIFWALLQLSLFIGNTFVFFAFKGQEEINQKTRTVVIVTLASVGVVGLLVVLCLPKATKEAEEDEPEEAEREAAPDGPLQALVGALRLFFTGNMLLLSVTFLYTGLELGFFSGVYSSCISFTKAFEDRKQLVGVSGIFIGLGEVLGGGLFGIFGNKTVKWGRDPIVAAGYVLHTASFFLIFANLPNESPFGDTDESAYITSNAVLAIFCSFLLGLGDSFYNTQIYSLLGSVYADRSAPAFAIFKFTQSIGAAASFFYAEHVGLYAQLGILLASGTLGSLAFIRVEWVARKRNLLLAGEQGKRIEVEASD
ncbi:unnamed protein product [Phyllotreta striolata]|uniref:UNC93-like protein MFSD11 n=1 Tax=Phyllotreta striolata TaxID=444603 RepID=A0A9N9TU53_PHYSR|nr:unnamed protein product [Phyllotreta striolata]